MARKRVLLLHGYAGSPSQYFFPWLVNQLNDIADVYCPTLPDPEDPRPEEWTKVVLDSLGGQSAHLTIAHSLGGTLALSMLSQSLLKTDCLMTFGSSHCPKDVESMNRFLVPPIELQRVKGRIPMYAFASYDDPYTFYDCSVLLVKQLGAIGIFYNDQGHFLGDRLPEHAWRTIKMELNN